MVLVDGSLIAAPATGGRPERREQWLGGFLQEQVLGLAADLHQGDVGEAGLPVLADGLDDRVQVGAAGDGLGDVLGPDELRRAGETRRSSAGRR